MCSRVHIWCRHYWNVNSRLLSFITFSFSISPENLLINKYHGNVYSTNKTLQLLFLSNYNINPLFSRSSVSIEKVPLSFIIIRKVYARRTTIKRMLKWRCRIEMRSINQINHGSRIRRTGLRYASFFLSLSRNRPEWISAEESNSVRPFLSDSRSFLSEIYEGRKKWGMPLLAFVQWRPLKSKNAPSRVFWKRGEWHLNLMGLRKRGRVVSERLNAPIKYKNNGRCILDTFHSISFRLTNCFFFVLFDK